MQYESGICLQTRANGCIKITRGAVAQLDRASDS